MGCARKPRAGGVREDFLAQHSMECLSLVSSEQDHFIGWVSYFFLLSQLNVKTTYLLMNKLVYNILDLESN